MANVNKFKFLRQDPKKPATEEFKDDWPVLSVEGPCPDCNHGDHSLLIMDVKKRHDIRMIRLQCVSCFNSFEIIHNGL